MRAREAHVQADEVTAEVCFVHNHFSQLAPHDLIACAPSDSCVFRKTDCGPTDSRSAVAPEPFRPLGGRAGDGAWGRHFIEISGCYILLRLYHN